MTPHITRCTRVVCKLCYNFRVKFLNIFDWWFPGQWKTLSQTTSWRAPKECDLKLFSGFYVHVYSYAHINMCKGVYIHRKVITKSFLISGRKLLVFIFYLFFWQSSMTQKYIVIILKVARLFLGPDYYIKEIVLSSVSEMWNSKRIFGAQTQPSNNSRHSGPISLVPTNSFLKSK